MLVAHVATCAGLGVHINTWPGLAAHIATWPGLVAHGFCMPWTCLTASLAMPGGSYFYLA